MREDDLQQLLGGLAARFDEASEPVDIDRVLAAPRREGKRSRQALFLLSMAAMASLIAAIIWAWPSLDKNEQATSCRHPGPRSS